MKMSEEGFNSLRNAVSLLDQPLVRHAYRTGNFANADKVKDLDKRYRWDLYYAAHGYRYHETGLKDTHIDTALRSIVSPL